MHKQWELISIYIFLRVIPDKLKQTTNENAAITIYLSHMNNGLNEMTYAAKCYIMCIFHDVVMSKNV